MINWILLRQGEIDSIFVRLLTSIPVSLHLKFLTRLFIENKIFTNKTMNKNEHSFFILRIL